MDRHVRRTHTDHPIFDCGQCERSFAVPAAKKRRIGIDAEFKLRRTRKSLGGAVEQFTVNMKEARHLSALKEAIAVFMPVMSKFHQEHRAYKFQIAVDPAVITQPPVTLASEMVAVYSDASPPLVDVYRQQLNFIEVYKHNESGWVFSNFASLQLTL